MESGVSVKRGGKIDYCSSKGRHATNFNLQPAEDILTHREATIRGSRSGCSLVLCPLTLTKVLAPACLYVLVYLSVTYSFYTCLSNMWPD